MLRLIIFRPGCAHFEYDPSHELTAAVSREQGRVSDKYLNQVRKNMAGEGSAREYGNINAPRHKRMELRGATEHDTIQLSQPWVSNLCSTTFPFA